MFARSGGDTASLSIWGVRAAWKTALSNAPKTATASIAAIRETALLIPEATPTCCLSTEFITVVVSGATLTAIPSPSTTTAGKNVAQ
jgi:hypothetical protein